MCLCLFVQFPHSPHGASAGGFVDAPGGFVDAGGFIVTFSADPFPLEAFIFTLSGGFFGFLQSGSTHFSASYTLMGSG